MGRTRQRTSPAASLPLLMPALALVVAVPARPQDLSCDDIVFKPRAIEAFPSAAQSCYAVVERDDGKLYVRLVADVVRVESDDSIVVDLKGRDGSRIRQMFHAPPGFRASIDGRLTPARDLRRGQEIRLYLPANWWEVADEAAGGAPAD